MGGEQGAPEGATMREIAAAMAVSIPTARERVRAMIEAGVCECAGRMPRISEVTGEKCSPVTYRMKKR